MNKMPSYLLFLCHGKTEATFVKGIVEKYIELKFCETLGEEESYYKNKDENPNIIIAEKWNGEIYLSINSFEKDVEQLISSGKERKDLSEKANIVSISIIDICEDENEDELKKNNVLNNHEEIIKDIAEKYQVNIDFSHLYYFEEKIETCLYRFYETIGNIKAPKHAKMDRWVSENIKMIWETDSKLTSSSIKELISKSKNTNIIKLFEIIDEWFESLNK